MSIPGFRSDVHGAFAIALAWAMGTAPSAAPGDTLTFGSTCGDVVWQSCCDCGVDQKCVNWNRPPSPAPICPNLPTGADDVIIAGNCTVIPSPSVAAMTIDQSGGTFTLQGGGLAIAASAEFDGPFVWNGGEIGRSGGAGSQYARINGGLTMQGSDDKFLSFFGGFRLINAGLAEWSGTGNWTVGMIPGAWSPAIFENAVGATFTVSNTASILQTAFGVGVIENNGTLVKSSSGLSEWAVTLNNTGLVHVQDGELRLTRAGVIAGTWMIDPGAEMAFAGNDFELQAGVVIQGRAVVKQSGGIGVKVDSDVTISDLTVADDGRLTGTGVLRVAGTLTNEAGDPSVHLHILPGGHLESSGAAPYFARLDVEGTAHLPAGANMGCFNQPLTVMPGGVFTIDDGATLGQTGLGTQPIENHGTIRKPATGGTATIANSFNWFLNNHGDGVISVEGGTLLCPSQLDSSGTINIAANATFKQQAWATYHAGTTFLGDGWFHLENTQNGYIDAGVTLAIPRLRISGSLASGSGIHGPGQLTITKEFEAQGGYLDVPLITILAGAVMNVSGPEFTGDNDVVFENSGRTNIVNQSLGFAAFNNRPGGIVDLQADFAFLHWFSNGPCTNEGTIVKSGGAGVSDVVVSLTNTGLVRAESGQMVFPNAQNTFVQNGGMTELAGGGIRVATMTLNGGVLRGVGTLTANVANVGAQVEPGASPGVLTIGSNAAPAIAGDYVQGAGGTLEIEVGGLTPATQHDQLLAAGTATLNGTLRIKLVNSFVPSDGDSVTVLTAGARSGNFSGIVQEGFPAGVAASVGYNATSVVVNFTNSNPVGGGGGGDGNGGGGGPGDGGTPGGSDDTPGGTPVPQSTPGACGQGACAAGAPLAMMFTVVALLSARRSRTRLRRARRN